ncbi:hypothetical protein DL765_007463 [Monosporascus sp. GIB2]|nr:hypothetical protein DL765_007463 [Monosporascus sp. GIB2]
MEEKRMERDSDSSKESRLPRRLEASSNASVVLAFAARVAAILSLFASLPVVEATFSIARCCTLAVREEFQTYWHDWWPWEVCNFNMEIDYVSNQTYPSIMKPMSWANQFCSGTQYSNLRQWLLPLATYISPYIGIILLCPVGEEDPDGRDPQEKRLRSTLHTVRTRAQEYISILGDPASAVFGAVSEVLADTIALCRLPRSLARQRPVWVATLVGALKFPHPGDRHDPAVAMDQSTEQQVSLLGMAQRFPASHAQETKVLDNPPCPPAVKVSTSLETDTWSDDRVDRDISLSIVVRANFANAILIPVVLTLAVIAATFYDAYFKKGDKETALALAYCVWYSWLLVVAVAGNCCATALKPDAAWWAFNNVITFRKGGRAIVALKDRHVNSQFWGNWVKKQTDSGGKEFAAFAADLASEPSFWLLFCAGQFLGWCCVAIASSAGAAIAWTTPTVGLGCRSFNFILYAIVAFVNAFLNILRSWLDIRAKSAQPEPPDKSDGDCGGRPAKVTFAAAVEGAYWLLVFANSAVMGLGTFLHLVGVFRTCWCDRLLWNDETMIELNSKTAEAVENASKYWMSTAYVVFSIMTLVCLSAIVLRQITVHRMDKWIEERKKADA